MRVELYVVCYMYMICNVIGKREKCLGKFLRVLNIIFFFSSRRRHTRLQGDWSSDVCSSDLSITMRQTVSLDFIVSKDSGEANMKGYYEGEGDGLPHGDTVTAILDAVIVFSIKIGRASCRERV